MNLILTLVLKANQNKQADGCVVHSHFRSFQGIAPKISSFILTPTTNVLSPGLDCLPPWVMLTRISERSEPSKLSTNHLETWVDSSPSLLPPGPSFAWFNFSCNLFPTDHSNSWSSRLLHWLWNHGPHDWTSSRYQELSRGRIISSRL